MRIMNLAALSLPLLVTGTALGAIGEDRLVGSCAINDDGVPTNVHEFHLDTETDPTVTMHYYRHVVFGEIRVQLSQERDDDNRLVLVATFIQAEATPWTGMPHEQRRERFVGLVQGDEVLFDHQDTGIDVQCRAEVTRVDTGRYFSAQDLNLKDVPHPRLSVHTTLPGQVDCAVELQFPDREPRAPLHTLLSKLEFHSAFTKLVPPVRLDEQARTITIELIPGGWSDAILFESVDHRSKLPDLIRQTLYRGIPSDGVILNVQRCEDSPFSDASELN